jgi:hypothetical protein
MNKLKLDLEKLVVESFKTEQDADSKGTVFAHHSEHSVCVDSGCDSYCSCYMTCGDGSCDSGCTMKGSCDCPITA